MVLYARLVRAEREGEDWRTAARSLLGLDVEADEAAARESWEAHLAQARWFWTGNRR